MDNANRPKSPEIIHLQNAIGAAQRVIKGTPLPLIEPDQESEPNVIPSAPSGPAPAGSELGPQGAL